MGARRPFSLYLSITIRQVLLPVTLAEIRVYALYPKRWLNAYLLWSKLKVSMCSHFSGHTRVALPSLPLAPSLLG